MKYQIRFTSQFKKDLKTAKKQGKNIDKQLRRRLVQYLLM